MTLVPPISTMLGTPRLIDNSNPMLVTPMSLPASFNGSVKCFGKAELTLK